jgi:hypothetical protein
LEFSLPSLINLEQNKESKMELRVNGRADQVMHDRVWMSRYFDLAVIRGLQQLHEQHLQLPSNHLRRDQRLPAKTLP